MLDPRDNTYTTRNVNFSQPANVTLRPRSGHSAVAYGTTQLVIFGGWTFNRNESRQAQVGTRWSAAASRAY